MDRKLILFLAGAIFFLMPWYLFNSGLPQPVDVAILLSFILFALSNFAYIHLISYSKVYRLFFYLILYTIIVLLINFIMTQSNVTLNLIIQNIYYFLLISIFMFIIVRLYHYHSLPKFLIILLYLLCISCCLPLADWLLHVRAGSRISLTFNNPNQLGFFALVYLSIIYYVALLSREYQIAINKIIAIILLNINLLFLFLSATRACYPIIILYLLAYDPLLNIKFKGQALWLYRFTAACLMIVLTGVIIYILHRHMQAIRFTKTANNFSSVSYDFYFRALRGLNFELMSTRNFLIGNGSYTTALRGTLEFHNNFIALFSELGLFGLLFYIYLNYVTFSKLWQRGFLYCIPFACYLFYSMFQYSFRTRLNWLFIAILIFLTIQKRLSTPLSKG